jgi:hypothetical protein
VRVSIYSNAFRLIRKADLGACPAGVVTRPVTSLYTGGMANGTYFYVISGESAQGSCRSKAEKILIVK